MLSPTCSPHLCSRYRRNCNVICCSGSMTVSCTAPTSIISSTACVNSFDTALSSAGNCTRPNASCLHRLSAGADASSARRAFGTTPLALTLCWTWTGPLRVANSSSSYAQCNGFAHRSLAFRNSSSPCTISWKLFTHTSVSARNAPWHELILTKKGGMKLYPLHSTRANLQLQTASHSLIATRKSASLSLYLHRCLRYPLVWHRYPGALL